MSKKLAAKTAAPKKAAKKRISAPRPVTIRMYRQGLGDAFLLTFAGENRGDSVFLLIDCGVHKAQTGGGDKMQRIVADITAATGGKIDVVVATHEHTDHLSGFVQHAQAFLQSIEIEQLWLGWTESRKDAVANRLRKKKGHLQKAIDAALKKLKDKMTLAAEQVAGDAIEPFFAFAEFDAELRADLETDDARRAAATAMHETGGNPTGNEVALQLLRERAKQVECLPPGTVIDLPGVRDARIYVLGPPRDEKLLKKSDPSGRGQSEVFAAPQSDHLGLASALLNLEGAALEGGDQGQELRDLREMTYPFDSIKRKSLDEIQRAMVDWQPGRTPQSPEEQGLHDLAILVSRHYGLPGDAAEETPSKTSWTDSHEVPDNAAWRRIEGDWIAAAGELALNLESDTNNTSLAIAIEIGPPGEGKVLLFPGDAQVGSWLSWNALEFHVAGRTVTINDLFRRTVLYKVSHHASHNGTLKALGLEKMGDDLIAMIPVDRAAASKLRGWNMPYPPLYRALQQKTRGRILRSDRDPTLDGPKPDGLTRDQWDAFKQTRVEDDLYFEIVIEA